MENVAFVFGKLKNLCRFQSNFFLPVPRIGTRRDGTTLITIASEKDLLLTVDWSENYECK